MSSSVKSVHTYSVDIAEVVRWKRQAAGRTRGPAVLIAATVMFFPIIPGAGAVKKAPDKATNTAAVQLTFDIRLSQAGNRQGTIVGSQGRALSRGL